jgi:hypothetical protein
MKPVDILKKLLDFLKKNYKSVIVIFLVIFFCLWSCNRQKIITNQAKKINTLEITNIEIQKDRDKLDKDLKELNRQYNLQMRENDSLKLVLKARQKELIAIQQKHKKEIDSLLNVTVPNDTVYARLQPIYPNYDLTPLIYPFSGSQIRQVYSTALHYPRMVDEFNLQGKSLKNCIDLNDGFEKANKNLTDQITNLKNNIALCDNQNKNYVSEISLLNKQNKRKNFWNWFWKGTTLISLTYAIVK